MIAWACSPWTRRTAFPRNSRRAGGSDVLARHRALSPVSFTALAIAAVARRMPNLSPPPGRPAAITAPPPLLLPMSPDHMSIQIAVNGLVALAWTTVLGPTLRLTSRLFPKFKKGSSAINILAAQPHPGRLGAPATADIPSEEGAGRTAYQNSSRN